ncbi:MAG TPA: cytochrome-c oxidase, cbb3-type subunit III [Thiotrichales bacterium]|nr:cytochrome-c oxidase, cbb3-type subunit III [Thiotrichales bacterium]HQT04071.1 cytochrome-c oxidase, cbb3-type subunit III [Thiotrichales bacterium]
MANENPWPNEGNTGHIWDEDLRELDYPPPLWWMLAFYAGFVMIVFYALYYPTIPTPTGNTKGLAGWTQMKEYHEDFETLNKWRAEKFAAQEQALTEKSVEEILADKNLVDYAVATSKALFGDYCAACHGAGGAGNVNYPILADDDWLWGGDVNSIYQSLVSGRVGNMPAYGAMLSAEQIGQVTDFVIAMSEGKAEDEAFAAGRDVYNSIGCAGCHMPDGSGMAALGAARLNDKVWRFSGERAEVIKTIAKGVNAIGEPETRQAVMPAFAERLGDKEVKRLSIYVHSLGGGK